jgi:hypothetical protein
MTTKPIIGVLTASLAGGAPETSTTSATVVTSYELALGNSVIGSYPTAAGAQSAAQAHGPGSYTITQEVATTTTVAGPATTYVVGSASPNNAVIVAPTTAVLTDAAGNTWGISGGTAVINGGGQVLINGVADTSTSNVIQLAYVNGLIWQESSTSFAGDPTPGTPRWWSKASPAAPWSPAQGTTVSPLPSSTGGGGSSGGSGSRPSYNTGTGLYVRAGKLYDANGSEFRIRGVDRCHYDSPSQPGISNAKANAVRMFMWQTSVGAAKYASVAQEQHIAYKEIPIVTMAVFPDGTTASCNSNANELGAGVDWWVSNAGTFKPLERNCIINIANEWGNGSNWQASYIDAVKRLRAAGYLGALMIDAPGCGQDYQTLLSASRAVFESDPQQNLIFSLHIYGGIATAAVPGVIASMAALSKTNGACYVVGEFGPGRNIGPSPTLTTPQSIVEACEANGIGWLAWAWDDNDLGGGASDNNWFSMTLKGPGYYESAADLTEYGQVMVPLLQQLAKPATTF